MISNLSSLDFLINILTSSAAKSLFAFGIVITVIFVTHPNLEVER